MNAIQLLEKIQPIWVERIAYKLAKGEGVRENFLLQIQQFFDLLKQAMITGDPSWLNTLLDGWADARTQTDLEKQEASLTPILNTIIITTYEVTYETLRNDEALLLIGSVLPALIHTLSYTTQKEANLHIQHALSELDIARDKLERLDKSKSDFISVAAHELKTPLTLIEGYSAMLREYFPEDDHEYQSVTLLKGVNNGTRRLREIVDDMIDVSLIDNNMLSLNFQPMWINKLIDIAKTELSDALDQRSQILDIRVFPGSDRMTFGDSERLYQAFRNILINSIKYTPDNGTITVDGRELPGFIEVTFTDTGIGIDTEDQELIFKKFGRIGDASLHSSGKVKFKGGGPGLGLSITKGIIEAHGGTIWVESDGYDEIQCPGSTFHILVPLLNEAPDPKITKLFSPIDTLSPSNESESYESIDPNLLTI